LLDPQTVRSILIEQAIIDQDISYSELFEKMGLSFSRPKVRSLCRLLGEIDSEGKLAKEPELAAFVVRGSDRLPGDGWWECRKYSGPREGTQARAFVRRIQRQASRYWQKQTQT
jgi:hypothetical protein